MNNQAIRDAYNKHVSAKESYEQYRWFRNKIQEAGHDMTLRSLQHVIARRHIDFTNYIEVGPGPGTWTKVFLKHQPQSAYDLVDISYAMLDQAKKQLAHHEHIAYIESDFIDFTTDKQYDFFFSSRALEYFDDKQAFVQKTYDLLAPGGSGVIITKMPHYGRKGLYYQKDACAMHNKQIHYKYLIVLLQQQGFSDIEVTPVTFSFPFLRIAAINTLLFKIFGRRPINWLSTFFAESYMVTFSK